MVSASLQWVAIAAEFLGLALIAVELYAPRLSARLRHMLDARNDRDNLDKAIRMRSLMGTVGIYIAVWITIVAVLSLQDPQWSVIANIALTFVTVLILLSVWISGLLVRIGVALGRGNSAGGVGLVLAVIGFSIELYQLIAG